ncbi:MAG: hypothetical protein O2887_14780 [Bacteroidetes bacterium]|nr:hypothetical protein [Bacteroidota bacterium]MDA1121732.1 hypothetical protein [Bacteroidota bacterium]
MSFRESPQGPVLNYPEFVNYIKLLTPTHFCWVQSSDDGDVSGTGAGTYQIEGDKYIENPLMFYSSRQALYGTVINFRRNIDGNKWEHYAESVTRNGEKLDDVYIDEVWAKAGINQ